MSSRLPGSGRGERIGASLEEIGAKARIASTTQDDPAKRARAGLADSSRETKVPVRTSRLVTALRPCPGCISRRVTKGSSNLGAWLASTQPQARRDAAKSLCGTETARTSWRPDASWAKRAARVPSASSRPIQCAGCPSSCWDSERTSWTTNAAPPRNRPESRPTMPPYSRKWGDSCSPPVVLGSGFRTKAARSQTHEGSPDRSRGVDRRRSLTCAPTRVGMAFRVASHRL